jgi:hypothetical protein
MDYRRRYFELTGDSETPYAAGQYGEGYKHSIESIARAVDALEAQQGGQYDYTRRMMAQFGPHLGVSRGQIYPETLDAGYDRFFKAVEDYRGGDTGGAVLGLLGGMTRRPQRIGMLGGLVDYMRERFER